VASDKFRIDSKTALVTGANVMIAGRTRTAGVTNLQDRHPDRIAWIAGDVRSDMTEGDIANPRWNTAWTENTPTGRFAEPEEMATCALFLCSGGASYVTGSVLVADGGYISH